MGGGNTYLISSFQGIHKHHYIISQITSSLDHRCRFNKSPSPSKQGVRRTQLKVVLVRGSGGPCDINYLWCCEDPGHRLEGEVSVRLE